MFKTDSLLNRSWGASSSITNAFRNIFIAAFVFAGVLFILNGAINATTILQQLYGLQSMAIGVLCIIASALIRIVGILDNQ